MQCMMGAMTAGAGATGARAWLAQRDFSWLTPKRMRLLTVGLLAAALVASSVLVSGSTPRQHAASLRSVSPAAVAQLPGVGLGAGYRPRASGGAVDRAAPVTGLRCSDRPASRYGAHLEIFANGQGVLIPPGIGVAPPRRQEGAYVRAGRCSYPARTLEPTGVIEIESGAGVTLGQLFALWGQPLSAHALGAFRAPRGARVAAYVDGAPWRGDPRAIPLRRHAAIVLEVNGFVAPHPRYRFAPGL
jgi:hypothetical protein